MVTFSMAYRNKAACRNACSCKLKEGEQDFSSCSPSCFVILNVVLLFLKSELQSVTYALHGCKSCWHERKS